MKKFLIFLFLSLFFSLPFSYAELRVDITQGQILPTPIAVTNFHGDDIELLQVGQSMAEVIRADLERSGLFEPIDSKAFIQDIESLRSGVRFADWRAINAQVMVKGLVQKMPDGRFRVEFRLYDVISESQMEGLAFFGMPADWRRIAHKISDAIYKRVTGEEGYFDTRIVYVAETGKGRHKIKRLAVMDQDGENQAYLTDGQSLVLTPRFSPTMHDITYLDFIRGKPNVYLMNLKERKRELLGNFPGMTFAPRFSPDGTKMVMSFASNGVTSLYLMDLRSRHVLRLTHDPVIDTSPSFSPDNHQIVFNSDRSGKPQLYVMNADGSNVRRISFSHDDQKSANYRAPVWSPRGDMIAFVKLQGGTFYIGVMRTDGTDERLLAQGWVIDEPCWAPNGRVLMFTRKYSNGKSRVFTIDLTGHNEREVPTQTDAEGATWSPLLRE